MRLLRLNGPSEMENYRKPHPCVEAEQGETLRQIDEAKICEVLQHGPDRCIVGNSPEIRVVFDLIRKYAVSDAPVLITGETGTGKELIANAVHSRSSRARGPF